jgi:hypothetical protein
MTTGSAPGLGPRARDPVFGSVRPPAEDHLLFWGFHFSSSTIFQHHNAEYRLDYHLVGTGRSGGDLPCLAFCSGPALGLSYIFPPSSPLSGAQDCSGNDTVESLRRVRSATVLPRRFDGVTRSIRYARVTAGSPPCCLRRRADTDWNDIGDVVRVGPNEVWFSESFHKCKS